jgi:hypothetical protein
MLLNDRLAIEILISTLAASPSDIEINLNSLKWHSMENPSIGKTVIRSKWILSPIIFRDKEPFDWYQRYTGIKDIITQYIQPTF